MCPASIRLFPDEPLANSLVVLTLAGCAGAPPPVRSESAVMYHHPPPAAPRIAQAKANIPVPREAAETPEAAARRRVKEIVDGTMERIARARATVIDTSLAGAPSEGRVGVAASICRVRGRAVQHRFSTYSWPGVDPILAGQRVSDTCWQVFRQTGVMPATGILPTY